MHREERFGRLRERRGLSLCAHLEETVSYALLRPYIAVAFLTVEFDHVAVGPVTILRLNHSTTNVRKNIALRKVVKIFERELLRLFVLLNPLKILWVFQGVLSLIGG